MSKRYSLVEDLMNTPSEQKEKLDRIIKTMVKGESQMDLYGDDKRKLIRDLLEEYIVLTDTNEIESKMKHSIQYIKEALREVIEQDCERCHERLTLDHFYEENEYDGDYINDYCRSCRGKGQYEYEFLRYFYDNIIRD